MPFGLGGERNTLFRPGATKSYENASSVLLTSTKAFPWSFWLTDGIKLVSPQVGLKCHPQAFDPCAPGGTIFKVAGEMMNASGLPGGYLSQAAINRFAARAANGSGWTLGRAMKL
jgi:hypothetical protein